MQNKIQSLVWHRTTVVREKRRAPSSAPPPVSAETVRRFHLLVEGLIYVALGCLLLFSEVYIRTRQKSRSLEIWTLARRKVEMESELTRLRMRITVLESPQRLESLAATEIGLTSADKQQSPKGRP